MFGPLFTVQDLVLVALTKSVNRSNLASGLVLRKNLDMYMIWHV